MHTTGRRRPLRPGALPPPLDPSVDDILYSGSDDDYYDNPGERHRRYEIQGQRYLQGRPLNIVSARLRGPFDQESGWQNPWLGQSKASRIAADHATETSRGRGSAPKSSGLNSNARQFSDSTHRMDNRTTKPIISTPLVQSSSFQIPTPASSDLRASAVQPYMQREALARIQAWRADVAVKVEPVGGIQTTIATPVAKSPVPTTSRGKRPASSQLLRNAVAKRSRISGLDLSMDEPPSSAGANQTPRTGQGQVLDSLFSTHDHSSSQRSQLGLDNFSGAALDGPVAGQTSISRAAQNPLSSPRSAFDGREESHVAPITPLRRPVLLPNGQQSGAVSKASGAQRSPLRSTVVGTNAILNSTQGGKKSQAAKEIVSPRPSMATPELRVASPLEFCSQADRSFQYRSKAPRISKTGALLEAAAARKAEDEEIASQSSTSTETASENSEAANEAVPEETAETFSKEPSVPNTFAEKMEELGYAPLEDAQSSSSSSLSSVDTSVMAEEAADTTAAAIDGPTLLPSSSASSRRQSVPSSPSACEKGVGAEETIGRKPVDKGDYAPPELTSISKPNTPPNKVVKLLLQAHPVQPVPAKDVAQVEEPQDEQVIEEESTAAVDAVVPLASQPDLGLSVDKVDEVKAQDEPPSSGQGALTEPATEPEPEPVLPLPQQQSPWAKEVISIAAETPHSQPRPPTQPIVTEATVHSEPIRTPGDSNQPATPVQQSPWTKESILPRPVDSAARVPSLLSVACPKQVEGTTLSPSIPAITASQNPWTCVEEKATEATYLRTADGLRRRSEVIPPPPVVSMKDSPFRPTVDTESVEASTKPHVPSTPTQQSSLPTPEPTTSIKSFRDFMSPSPEPRRRSRAILSSGATRVDKLQRRKSALSKSLKDRAKRAQLRVSFSLPGANPTSSPATGTDPDETLDGAELPSRAAESPSLVRKASSQAPSHRASSPPLQLSQAELPAEGTRFSKFFRTQARKGPQVRRGKNYKPLLPSASQQRCGSPDVDAMAEAFLEADRARSSSGQDITSGGDSRDPSQRDHEGLDTQEQTAEEGEEEAQETDDVTAVIDNLGEFLNSFDVDADLDRARREMQERERDSPQHLGLGFPSTQDQMEILGAGVWD